MKTFKPKPGTFIEINATLLYAGFLGVVSYMCWPTDPRWWGFGVISVFSGLAAFTLVVKAAKLIFDIWMFERPQKEFLEQGNPVKSSSLASNEAMKNDGVIRDGN